MVEDASSAWESGKPCGSHVEGVGDNLPESDDVTRPNEPETLDPFETSTHSPETVVRHTSLVGTTAEPADRPRVVDDSDIVELQYSSILL